MAVVPTKMISLTASQSMSHFSSVSIFLSGRAFSLKTTSINKDFLGFRFFLLRGNTTYRCRYFHLVIFFARSLKVCTFFTIYELSGTFTGSVIFLIKSDFSKADLNIFI